MEPGLLLAALRPTRGRAALEAQAARTAGAVTQLVATRTSACRGCGVKMLPGQTIWFIKRIGAFCTEQCIETDIDGWLMALDERLEAAKVKTDRMRVLLRVADPTDGQALEAMDDVFEALDASLWYRRRQRHWDEIRRKKKAGTT